MIDIHAHIIPNVDDGSKGLNESKEILLEEIRQGVTDIILTPHHRHHMFETSVEEINQSFFSLQKYVKENNIDINLYLGQEIYIRKFESLKRNINEVNENKALTFGNSKFVLLEFSYTEDIDLTEVAYMTNKYGYIPIIAHIERYKYIDGLSKVNDIINQNAFIQINASSIVGRDGFKAKRFVYKLIANDLVHFVSSDIHYNRKNYMEKAYKKISKKFGKEKADKLFEINARNILLSEVK